jgi:Ubiquitin-fold modifier-conjugating enzyme 1.
LTPIELELPELDGKTVKMYRYCSFFSIRKCNRGGKICLDVHFAPLWSKNSPKFGIAHALALAVRKKKAMFKL